MAERVPFVAGNWKMNFGPAMASQFALALRPQLEALTSRVEIALCPPFISIPAVGQALDGSSIRVGAQDAYYEDSGAFTGEVAAAQLAGLCDYVIIGHSERRQYFGETDVEVFLKAKAVLAHGLRAIVCVGERLPERDAGRTAAVIRGQLWSGLGGLEVSEFERVVVAYEPVWAIGTGRAATPEQAQEVAGLVREELQRMFGPVSRKTRIQYGGSVNQANCATFFRLPDIDGALVGGASLKEQEFVVIVQSCAQVAAGV
ncbi:MAG: triose-phosphate isomerase [Chloroflexi bacterium]|nr:triose-phosphate isomerase [Chloroflexota bacterium]